MSSSPGGMIWVMVLVAAIGVLLQLSSVLGVPRLPEHGPLWPFPCPLRFIVRSVHPGRAVVMHEGPMLQQRGRFLKAHVGPPVQLSQLEHATGVNADLAPVLAGLIFP